MGTVHGGQESNGSTVTVSVSGDQQCFFRTEGDAKVITPKMRSCRTQILALILAGLIAQPVTAEVIPGRWEKGVALETASPITVNLKNGDRIKGQFRGLSPSDLELLSPAGWAAIPRTDIQTITLPSKDGWGDGTWKGTAVGAAVAGGSSLIRIAAGGPGRNEDDSAMLALIGFALFAGFGAGIGIAVDAATKPEDIVVYKAPENS